MRQVETHSDLFVPVGKTILVRDSDAHLTRDLSIPLKKERLNCLAVKYN